MGAGWMRGARGGGDHAGCRACGRASAAREAAQTTQDAARERASAAHNAPQFTQDAAREHASAAHNAPQTTQDAARERGWHEGRSPRALGHPYRVDRLRFVTGALIHADSHRIAHSTRHRKSRSPRQRARGLRPSCHPALRAGVLGGAESAARERARIDQRLRNRICRRCHSAHASTSRSAFIAVIRGMSLRGEP